MLVVTETHFFSLFPLHHDSVSVSLFLLLCFLLLVVWAKSKKHSSKTMLVFVSHSKRIVR